MSKNPEHFQEPQNLAADSEEPFVIPIEASIDLHTFRPGEVGDLLSDYLEAAWNKGLREVRIIHGKGAGILREKVRSILHNHPLVVSFRQADDSRGGWGATMVLLREEGKGLSDRV